MLNQPSISFVKANRLVWNVEAKPTPESQKLEENKKPSPAGLEKLEKNGKKLKNPPDENPNQKAKELLIAEKALDTAYNSKEIPAELKKLSQQQIRNLERKNPELLFKTCFSKIGEGGKLFAIENPAELKAGDQIRFAVEDAAGQNNNLEMGAGLRTLPSKFKVVQIGNEKFYRMYAGGPFVNAEGGYRAVRTHQQETIVLTEENIPPEIENRIKEHRGSFARQDVNFALDSWLNGRELTPELADQFAKEMEGSQEFTPEMQGVLKSQM
jgi:hypothetical protein